MAEVKSKSLGIILMEVFPYECTLIGLSKIVLKQLVGESIEGLKW
jgi:hypothetical protein